MTDLMTTTHHPIDFPYNEIAKPNGDRWLNVQEALDAGYPINQIWTVTEASFDDGSGYVLVYGPPHHYINLLHVTVTTEKHDHMTYYEEFIDDLPEETE